MLERLRPSHFNFFDLFERHATCALEGLKVLENALTDWPNAEQSIPRVIEAEHECDSLTHMTVDLMRRTYITPFERDEIRHLISRMDDVIDHAQGAASRAVLFQIHAIPEEMVKVGHTLVAAQEHIVTMVKLLRDIKKAQAIETHCREVNRLENEGDRLLREGLANLFATEKDPILVMKLKEIFERLEAAIDRCEDVANILEGILIEHVG